MLPLSLQPRFVIRHLSFVISLATLVACHHSKPSQQPTIEKHGIQVPSISMDADTGWTAAPVARGTPLFTDNYYSIQFVPADLFGSLLIQRPESVAVNGGYLDGKVSVPTDAILYVAVLTQVGAEHIVPDANLNAFASEGWTPIPGIFNTSTPNNLLWYWTLFAHPIPPGPVTLTSDALPHPGILIIGKTHEPPNKPFHR